MYVIYSLLYWCICRIFSDSPKICIFPRQSSIKFSITLWITLCWLGIHFSHPETCNSMYKIVDAGKNLLSPAVDLVAGVESNFKKNVKRCFSKSHGKSKQHKLSFEWSHMFHWQTHKIGTMGHSLLTVIQYITVFISMVTLKKFKVRTMWWYCYGTEVWFGKLEHLYHVVCLSDNAQLNFLAFLAVSIVLFRP